MNTLSVKFELPIIIASQVQYHRQLDICFGKSYLIPETTNFDIGEGIEVGLNFDNISRDVKQIFAMFLYEHKHISHRSACEVGGFSQWEFFEMNRQLSIPIHYTQNELEKDMERLSDV